MNEEAIRQSLKDLLNSGLKTRWEIRAYTSDEVARIVNELQNLSIDDYTGKLVTAGFTLVPFESDDISQSCQTCMYYLIHRKFCELPELNLPVEPEWSCTLWRI